MRGRDGVQMRIDELMTFVAQVMSKMEKIED